MTLLSVVKDVCAVVGVAVPTSVFTSLNTNRTMQEMVALANEMAQRISYDTREWTLYKLTKTYTGDGVTEGFSLPANYLRMLLTGNVWRSTSTQNPMTFEPDLDIWLNRRANGWTLPNGEWTMYGGQIHFAPVLGTGVTAYHAYLDKNCVNLASGGVGATFVADNDTFRLNERLLRLGMIFQWKAQKGQPYAEDMGTFGDALQIAMGSDQPAPIMVDRSPISSLIRGANIAYPWPVPTS
jgi:hypothetical protein